jgi:hypothetical protein
MYLLLPTYIIYLLLAVNSRISFQIVPTYYVPTIQNVGK